MLATALESDLGTFRRSGTVGNRFWPTVRFRVHDSPQDESPSYQTFPPVGKQQETL